MKTIAIIGGGFSGTMAAIHLLKASTSEILIYLIEPDHIAKGIAYGCQSEELLLNVRADAMGAFPEDKNGFYKWLQDKGTYKNTDLVPRKIYGEYLEEIFQSSKVNLPEHIHFQIIKATVVNIENKKIFFDSHKSISADDIILASGMGAENIESQLAHVNSQTKSITIVGTGLSMIDALVCLKKSNYKGKITAVSRRGKIPLPHDFHAHSSDSPTFDFTQDYSLKAVVSSFKEKLKIHSWRLVVDAIRPHSQQLWCQWTLKEKSQFLRYLNPIWNPHRHRMSPHHDEILKLMVKEKQLTIKSIGFKDYRPNDEVVINCQGPSITKSELIKKLINNRLLELDQFKLGVTPLVPWLHTLGPLKRGELWESTAVPELRVQAKELTNKLLAKQLE